MEAPTAVVVKHQKAGQICWALSIPHTRSHTVTCVLTGGTVLQLCYPAPIATACLSPLAPLIHGHTQRSGAQACHPSGQIRPWPGPASTTQPAVLDPRAAGGAGAAAAATAAASQGSQMEKGFRHGPPTAQQLHFDGGCAGQHGKVRHSACLGCSCSLV